MPLYRQNEKPRSQRGFSSHVTLVHQVPTSADFQFGAVPVYLTIQIPPSAPFVIYM